MKDNKLKQCPHCEKWEVYELIIKGQGKQDWCANCREFVKEYGEVNKIHKIERKIKNVYLIAFIFGGFSLFHSFRIKFNGLEFIIAILLLILGFGVYKKSRISVILMFAINNLIILFMAYIIFMHESLVVVPVLIILILFSYLIYYSGIKTIFEYHKLGLGTRG